MRRASQLAAVLLVFVIASSGASLAATQAVGPIKVRAPISTAPEIVLVGRLVYAEGQRVGRVDAVETDGDGRIVTIDVALANILALGPKTVRVPGDKIAQTGLEVRLAMTAEEVGLLPSIDGEPE